MYSHHVSIRLILALTAMPGWHALDLDAEAAFVSSVLGDNMNKLIILIISGSQF